jgi:hypothetical protein
MFLSLLITLDLRNSDFDFFYIADINILGPPPKYIWKFLSIGWHQLQK